MAEQPNDKEKSNEQQKSVVTLNPENIKRYGKYVVNTTEIKYTKFRRAVVTNPNEPAKVILSMVLENIEDAHKFEKNEAIIYDLINRVPHPYLPKMLHYHYIMKNDKEDGIFVGLSDIKGTNLDAVLALRPMSINYALNIFLQITSAVAHCHSLGIIINDLSTSKIFFTDTDNRKIIFADLIFAKIIKNDLFLNPGKALVSEKSTRYVYTSPETFKCNAIDGLASNVYALGVILFRMIFGHFPIISNDKKEMVSMIVTGNINWSKQIPKPIEDLLKSMLNLNPLERPSAVSIINLEFLQNIVNTLDISQFKNNLPFSLTKNPTPRMMNAAAVTPTVVVDTPTTTTYTCPVCQHVFQRQAIMYSHMHSAHPQRGRGRGRLEQTDKK